MYYQYTVPNSFTNLNTMLPFTNNFFTMISCLRCYRVQFTLIRCSQLLPFQNVLHFCLILYFFIPGVSVSEQTEKNLDNETTVLFIYRDPSVWSKTVTWHAGWSPSSSMCHWWSVPINLGVSRIIWMAPNIIK